MGSELVGFRLLGGLWRVELQVSPLPLRLASLAQGPVEMTNLTGIRRCWWLTLLVRGKRALAVSVLFP